MAEDLKYFIPDIQDLRAGYECELLWNQNMLPEENWYSIKVNEDGTEDFDFIDWVGKVANSKIRVPYLTKEQIETEGWKFKYTNKTRWWYEKDDTFFECPMTTGYQIMRLDMVHDPEYKAITIKAYYRGEAGYDKSEGVDLPTIFEGYCKDINTFRYICKLLNIK